MAGRTAAGVDSKGVEVNTLPTGVGKGPETAAGTAAARRPRL